MSFYSVPAKFAPLFIEETDEIREITPNMTLVDGLQDTVLNKINRDWLNITVKHLNRKQRKHLEREDLFDHYAKKRCDTLDRMRAKLAARKKN
jgi:hypothetical protein